METMPLSVPVTQRVEVRSAGNRQHSTELSLFSEQSYKHINMQCCGAGAGGAEIIWDLEPEPELNF